MRSGCVQSLIHGTTIHDVIDRFLPNAAVVEKCRSLGGRSIANDRLTLSFQLAEQLDEPGPQLVDSTAKRLISGGGIDAPLTFLLEIGGDYRTRRGTFMSLDEYAK